MTTKPNIIFVHGAWGDGSHWRHVLPPHASLASRAKEIVALVEEAVASLT